MSLAFSTTLASVCFLLDTFPRLKVRNKSGLTVDGLQEYYDEACLAVLNNRLVLKIETQDIKQHAFKVAFKVAVIRVSM